MSSRSLVLTLAILGLGAVAGCKGSTGSLQLGETCHASTECAAGLVCDFGQTPPVCSSSITPGEPDAMPEPDAPPGTPDAAPVPDAPPGAPDAAPDAAIPDAAPPDAAPVDAGTPDA